MAADIEGHVDVLVEHPFEYTGRDGRRIAIRPNERYRLLRRSTPHWWHVRREPGGRPFYLPALYVREVPVLGTPALPAPPARAPRLLSAPILPARLYTPPAASMRPAQSLDDLVRAAAPPGGPLEAARRAKASSVAGSWVCPRPLARRGSEDVEEAAAEGTPEQVGPGAPALAPVCGSPAATRREDVRAGTDVSEAFIPPTAGKVRVLPRKRSRTRLGTRRPLRPRRLARSALAAGWGLDRVLRCESRPRVGRRFPSTASDLSVSC